MPHVRSFTALVQHVHAYANELGLKRMVLVPSNLGLHVYRRLGYQPLLYFSVFRPTIGAQVES